MHGSTPSPSKRIPLMVAGTLAGLFAAGLLAIGGLALWANHKKDDQGYLSTSSHTFSASTAALTTGNLDLDGVGWLADHYGKVKLKVAPQTGKRVFVGIARTTDVRSYLRGVAHTDVTSVDYWPFDANYRSHGGARRATPPARRQIWAASAQGDTKQTLTWHAKTGNWSVVVMNADGSPGVQTRISAGAKVPWLAAAGWSSLGIGLFMAAGAAGLFVVASRQPRRGPSPAVAPVY